VPEVRFGSNSEVEEHPPLVRFNPRKRTSAGAIGRSVSCRTQTWTDGAALKKKPPGGGSQIHSYDFGSGFLNAGFDFRRNWL